MRDIVKKLYDVLSKAEQYEIVMNNITTRCYQKVRCVNGNIYASKFELSNQISLTANEYGESILKSFIKNDNDVIIHLEKCKPVKVKILS